MAEKPMAGTFCWNEPMTRNAAARKSGTLGARVHVAGMDIPGSSRFGIFEDPTGAQLAVFQPAAPAPKAKPDKRAKKRVARKAMARHRRN